ncbi:MAG: C40 family peptidase [Fibrobacter sp.]|nr:NlpC/P60 family protein [Fibrobacter sp.]MBR4785924.1 C40 family peptidase [Fibrobacter sp.]
MGPSSKYACLMLIPLCAGLLSCSFPVRTGYDRSIGDYKPVPSSNEQIAEAPAADEQVQENVGTESSPSGEDSVTTESKPKHMNSADKARAAVKKKEAEKAAQKSAPPTNFEAYAKGWLGAKYVYGAASKNKTDCSGYVMQVYQGYYKIALDHSAAKMYDDSRGKSVSRGNLREGDLIFFGSFWKIDHVGIYLSGDRFIHASSSRGVVISNLNEKYYKNKYQGARRFK